MQKKITYISILLFSLLSFGQKIKTITEFKNEKDSLIKVRETTFDNSGNLIKEIIFGEFDDILKTYRNKNQFFEYKDGRRVSEYSCEDFISKDTCVVRSFSTYKYNPKTRIETETKYESDSLIRFIREIKNEKSITISKTNSWEFFPVKLPDYENSTVLMDTTYFDKKNRIIKRVSFSNDLEKPLIENYKYSKKGYSYQIIGNANDKTINIVYSEIQKIIDENNLNFHYESNEEYKYEIEYY
ncbi:hypothetical protein KBJ98_15010 [Flavobacterium sp. F-328]|uniref:YD repeat-containing protein n=1 Tax=Flavobacterium erciyesense TaxID=2825842 RepID=A0ABS5D7P3_9FLAO|nr:hypothetical protein [Flavobacterium erciyesense]MBQ0910020.1 hypothetical protein [Flavobacterium erciyesense]